MLLCTALPCRWLDAELRAAELAGERVCVIAHHPIGQGSCRPTHAAWNWRELQQRMVDSPSVAFVLTGHDHLGGYACIEDTHFVTLEAMCEGGCGVGHRGARHV